MPKTDTMDVLTEGKTRTQEVELEISGRTFKVGRLGIGQAFRMGTILISVLTEEKRRQIADKIKAQPGSQDIDDLMTAAGYVPEKELQQIIAAYLGTDDIEFVKENVKAAETIRILDAFLETNEIGEFLKNLLQVMVKATDALKSIKSPKI